MKSDVFIAFEHYKSVTRNYWITCIIFGFVLGFSIASIFYKVM